ncbi:rod shape-determining protein MreC [Tibeticola sp.]|jgi:rod shape-determining protein MreC|uniref:rod shape-determining protein MreC n=1 Tax=Tibeticola sp. TaxID=2005368 RepID=UPI002586075E|nr:rod shape-determining protein MreC [Tibeticola sp.]MCI4440456.1 rod shape-determining protein MreC [Tibeticola sp.]
MSLNTLEHSPPPFFRQGPSALSKLLFFSALAVFLMVADTRLQLSGPVRSAVATAIYPVQWLVMQPVRLAREVSRYFVSVDAATQAQADAARRLAELSLQAGQVQLLTLENERLRRLLDLRARTTVASRAAQVLYQTSDPYSKRLVIDKGQLQGVTAGSPVLDESGLLGQITRVYPLVSELTLVVDRGQLTPVLNVRTGARGVAAGEPSADGASLALRYVPANADVIEGDLLVTSGIDGVYPPGIPVARVRSVQHQSNSAFAGIVAQALAQVNSARHVLVLEPLNPVPVAPPVEPTEPRETRRRKP